MFSAVIFDIDGTLVDSGDGHARAWQEALRHFGKEVPYHEIRNQIGKGGDQTLPVFLSPDEIERFGKQLDRFKSQLYRREYMPRVRPFPRVRELLQRLRDDRKRLALATSAEPPELRHNLELMDVADLIDVTTSADEAARTKPFPDIFHAALRKLGHPPPSEVIVVGDSPYDAEAAGQVPLATIGMLCGGYSERQLRDAGCAAIYRDPADLLARYHESPISTGVVTA